MEVELAHMSDEEVLNKLGLLSQGTNGDRRGNSLSAVTYLRGQPVHSGQGKQ